MEYLNKFLRKGVGGNRKDESSPKKNTTFTLGGENENLCSTPSTPRKSQDADAESDTTADYESAGETSPWKERVTTSLSELANTLAGVHLSTPTNRVHRDLHHFPFSPISAEDEDDEVTSITSNNSQNAGSLSLMKEDVSLVGSVHDKGTIPSDDTVAISPVEEKQTGLAKEQTMREDTHLMDPQDDGRLKVGENIHSPFLEFEDAGPTCSFHSEMMTSMTADGLPEMSFVGECSHDTSESFSSHKDLTKNIMPLKSLNEDNISIPDKRSLSTISDIAIVQDLENCLPANDNQESISNKFQSPVVEQNCISGKTEVKSVNHCFGGDKIGIENHDILPDPSLALLNQPELPEMLISVPLISEHPKIKENILQPLENPVQLDSEKKNSCSTLNEDLQNMNIPEIKESILNHSADPELLTSKPNQNVSPHFVCFKSSEEGSNDSLPVENQKKEISPSSGSSLSRSEPFFSHAPSSPSDSVKESNSIAFKETQNKNIPSIEKSTVAPEVILNCGNGSSSEMNNEELKLECPKIKNVSIRANSSENSCQAVVDSCNLIYSSTQNSSNISENVKRLATEKHPSCIEDSPENIRALTSPIKIHNSNDKVVSTIEEEILPALIPDEESIKEMCNLIKTTFNDSSKEKFESPKGCGNFLSTPSESSNNETSSVNIVPLPVPEGALFPGMSQSSPEHISGKQVVNELNHLPLMNNLSSVCNGKEMSKNALGEPEPIPNAFVEGPFSSEKIYSTSSKDASSFGDNASSSGDHEKLCTPGMLSGNSVEKEAPEKNVVPDSIPCAELKKINTAPALTDSPTNEDSLRNKAPTNGSQSTALPHPSLSKKRPLEYPPVSNKQLPSTLTKSISEECVNQHQPELADPSASQLHQIPSSAEHRSDSVIEPNEAPPLPNKTSEQLEPTLSIDSGRIDSNEFSLPSVPPKLSFAKTEDTKATNKSPKEFMKMSYEDLLEKCSEQERLLSFDVSIKEEAEKLADKFSSFPESDIDSEFLISRGSFPSDSEFKNDELLVEDDQFHGALDFDFDYLSKIHGNKRKVRESLFLKFDPLATSESPIRTPSKPREMVLAAPDSTDHESLTPKMNGEGLLVVVTPCPDGRNNQEVTSSPTSTSRPRTLRRSTGQTTPNLHQEILGKEIARLQEMLINQEVVYQEQTAAYCAEIEELRQQLEEYKEVQPSEELKNELAAVKAQNESKDDEIKTLKKDCTSLRQVISQFKEVVDTIALKRENEKILFEQKISDLERDLELERNHLRNAEDAFNDIHLKYEKAKHAIESFRTNEKEYKTCIEDNRTTIDNLDEQYKKLKEYASEKLQKANSEISEMKKAHEMELAKLAAVIRKLELENKTTKNSLAAKIRENMELSTIYDDLMKMSSH